MLLKIYPKLLCVICLVFYIFKPLIAQKTSTEYLPYRLQNEIRQKDQIRDFCGFDGYLSEKRQSAAFVNLENKINKQILAAQRQDADTLITIPVVFHIIHTNPDSVADADAYQMLADLNAGFSKTGPFSGGAGVDTKIRFCIAKTDPDGGTTTGITRTTHYISDTLNTHIEDRRIKNIIQWPPDAYVNIWYVKSMELWGSLDFSCGQWIPLKGTAYATFPGTEPDLDGIVTVGGGVGLIHEMSHYLSLYHIWEGFCQNNNCSLEGDRVCDTPPDRNIFSYPCSMTENSCSTDSLSGFTTDQLDLKENFMDYGNKSCMNMFTQGQKDRMRAALQTLRTGLLEAKCTKPCGENSNAYFKVDNFYPLPGNTVNFTNASTGATNYAWYVDGTLVSNSQNYAQTFSAVGKYKVVMRAYNSNANCYSSYMRYVHVRCGVTARFYPSQVRIASTLPLFPDSILFRNMSENATEFQWFVSTNDGVSWQMFSTNPHVYFTFPNQGYYLFKLVAKNGNCIDTTEAQKIEVMNATPDMSAYVYNVNCYQDSGLRLRIMVCNYGYSPLPAGTPISFYESDPRQPGARRLQSTIYLQAPILGLCCMELPIFNVWYNHTGFKNLYISLNDSGSVNTPITFPNSTLPEADYTNNILYLSNEFIATINPPGPINNLQPFSTLPLGFAANEVVTNIKWSTPQHLSCTTCPNPVLTIDSTTTKTLIVKSEYGCYDTAQIRINVPPSDDFTVDVLNADCRNGDSTKINFTINNAFQYGKIHKNLQVAFYNGNPQFGTAQLLQPIFKVPNTINNQTANFTHIVNYMTTGNLYAVVNDLAIAIPVTLPNTTFTETNFANNFTNIAFDPNTYSQFDQTICEGENVFGHSTTGTFVDTLVNANGCDSLRTLNLLVNNNPTHTINKVICEDESYLGYAATGVYEDHFVSATGCDSTRILNLIVNVKTYSTLRVTICEGQTHLGYTLSGTYVDTLTNAKNCDSIRTLHLYVKPKKYSQITATICEGESFEGYTQSGVFQPVFTSSIGCDSIRTINLTVLPTKRTQIHRDICRSDSAFLQNQWQFNSGIYYDTLQSAYQCDSVLITNLTVHELPKPNIGLDSSLCVGTNTTLTPGNYVDYLWQDGSTNPTLLVDTVGQYFVRVTDANGCKNSDTLIIKQMLPLPANFLQKNDRYCRGNGYPIYLPGFKNYLWQDSSGHTIGTGSGIEINGFGSFALTVTDKYGCVGTEHITLFDKNCLLYAFPTAFTPNGDGLNETIRPIITQKVVNYRFSIFNRWGQMVFSTTDRFAGWNGKFKGEQQPIGAYVYQISFNDFDGRPHFYKGSLMLVL